MIIVYIAGVATGIFLTGVIAVAAIAVYDDLKN